MNNAKILNYNKLRKNNNKIKIQMRNVDKMKTNKKMKVKFKIKN